MPCTIQNHIVSKGRVLELGQVCECRAYIYVGALIPTPNGRCYRCSAPIDAHILTDEGQAIECPKVEA